MKMGYSLNLELSQKLIMTPELRQAIEILQYNSLELTNFVHEELMTNPVLELYSEKVETAFEKENSFLNKLEKIDWKKVVDDYDRNKSSYNKVEVKDDVNYDNFVASEDSLSEHLLFQLQFAVLDKKYNDVGKYIIENIDDNGYLRLDNNEIEAKFNISNDEVEDVIQTIQTFEPAGVCARDLEECLLIQVQMKGIDNKVVIAIINHHLDDLAYNRLKNIAKALSIKETEVQDAVDVVKSLEPKPGRLFSSLQDIKYIVPDVTIEYMQGEYVVLVNDSTAPRLKINSFYQKILKEAESEKNTAEYISLKLNSALKLIRSIEQRRNTIYNVVNAIITHQREFFDHGTMYLKTLNLKDVAEEIGVHESTVSRAVNGKYLQCPRGLFEIKYFFQSGVSSAYGDGISSESIKTIIKDMVDNENPKKPLSDQAISNEINKIGIKISRRTVAKYRDELHISSSSKRKRY